MNQFEPSEVVQNPPAENQAGLFFWILLGTMAIGGLPYLYPASST